jgi:hypothetical protein
MADTNLFQNRRAVADADAATMKFMGKLNRVLVAAFAVCMVFAERAQAQNSEGTGTLEFAAFVSPTGAKPEPVREFTFYVLTKSFDDIKHEIEEANGAPNRDKFIEGLKLSPELREWLRHHETLDLTLPGTDKQITSDDILHVPEFLAAYQRSNSGGVANGIPKPKYKDSDKTDHPEKYEKEHDSYFKALKGYIQGHPESIAGIELEMEGINPAKKWAEAQNGFKKRVNQQAPMLAQTKYLTIKVDTNLDGRARVTRLPAGSYWLSTLGMEAGAGDSRLKWDVPVTIPAGQTVRLELTNLNSTETAKFR